MTQDVHTYRNGKSYREVSTYDFKKDFSKLLRQMNNGDYEGVAVTSYGRVVGVFLPASRLVKKRDAP
jgi:antitoxin (DNA-binding transcriptional repressor) of toxin-antitoxin stability system